MRALNENVAREISENQKQLHGLDAAVKSKRAVLKHLEYDVNVIEKVCIITIFLTKVKDSRLIMTLNSRRVASWQKSWTKF